MALNEHSSPRLASLAARVLRNPSSPPEALELAASVLTQAPDHAPRNAVLDAVAPYNALAAGNADFSLWDWSQKGVPNIWNLDL